MNLLNIKKIIELLGLCLYVSALNGVDVSEVYSIKNYACLKKQNNFVIVRASRSNGLLDNNAITNLKNANKSGLQTGVYMFPCRGKNATDQMYTFINSLKQVKQLYEIVWIDVQLTNNAVCSWTYYNTATNCDFLLELFSAIKDKNKTVGVYTNAYYWGEIFGSSKACVKAGEALLWYAHYDNKPNFSDFKAFGGWTKPYMKQYAQNIKVCTANTDLNWRQ